MIRNYNDALKFFTSLEFFGMKFGLEQTLKLAKFAGNPQAGLKFVHVAGTNGKGTICALLASALSAAGFRTGLYSSPHLVSPRERMRIDARAISEDDFAKFAATIETVVEKLRAEGGQPTYFEVNTVMALLYFKKKKVDFVVWESGLGGRLDATNIVDPELSIISSIGKDHCAYLGKTIKQIALEKAGIIKAGKAVFCGRNMNFVAKTAINDVVKRMKSHVIFCDKEASIVRHGVFKGGSFDGQVLRFDGCRILLFFPGVQQKHNLSLVCEVLKYLSKRHSFSYENALMGLSLASLPGRFNMMCDGTIIDGAHNPQAVLGLIRNLKIYFGTEKFSIIFACLRDKDARSMLNSLLPLAQDFRFVPLLASRKAYSPDELLHLSASFTIVRKAYSSLSEALLEKSERKLILGSFYLAGEALRCYFKEEEIINWRIR